MASEAGHPDPKVMCSYFVSGLAQQRRDRIALGYGCCTTCTSCRCSPSDRRTAPPHIAYFVDIVERLRAMRPIR